MSQRLACDDDKACLVQLEWLLYCEMERPGNLYRLILQNNSMDDAGTKENPARTSPG